MSDSLNDHILITLSRVRKRKPLYIGRISWRTGESVPGIRKHLQTMSSLVKLNPKTDEVTLTPAGRKQAAKLLARPAKKRNERWYEIIAPAMNPQELAVYQAIKKLGGGTLAEITAEARPGLKSRARNVQANVRWCLRRLVRIHRLVMMGR